MPMRTAAVVVLVRQPPIVVPVEVQHPQPAAAGAVEREPDVLLDLPPAGRRGEVVEQFPAHWEVGHQLVDADLGPVPPLQTGRRAKGRSLLGSSTRQEGMSTSAFCTSGGDEGRSRAALCVGGIAAARLLGRSRSRRDRCAKVRMGSETLRHGRIVHQPRPVRLPVAWFHVKPARTAPYFRTRWT